MAATSACSASAPTSAKPALTMAQQRALPRWARSRAGTSAAGRRMRERSTVSGSAAGDGKLR